MNDAHLLVYHLGHKLFKGVPFSVITVTQLSYPCEVIILQIENLVSQWTLHLLFIPDNYMQFSLKLNNLNFVSWAWNVFEKHKSSKLIMLVIWSLFALSVTSHDLLLGGRFNLRLLLTSSWICKDRHFVSVLQFIIKEKKTKW